MKPLIAFLLVLFNMPLAEAQINFVPNPSFEDTVYCPYGVDQMDACLGWASYRNSPDYFNACGTNGFSVPNATWGYQFANSGVAFAAVGTYRRINSSSGPNYREVIGTSLSTALQIGTKYYFSFYAVRADSLIFTGFSSNNLGVKFLTNSYSKISPIPINNFSHLKFDSILFDSVNWTKISGSFIADSNYNHIAIGNFYNDILTDTFSTILNPEFALYYVDDVCVSTDSIYNNTWTGIINIKKEDNLIWPNPSTSYINFSFSEDYDELQVVDVHGRIIIAESNISRKGRIEIGFLFSGVYFLIIKNSHHISSIKIVKL